MLDHILATTQAFEREHGIAPNVVFLNTTHFQVLQSVCPGLFDNQEGTSIQLGVRLVIMNDGMLMHPRAARLPNIPYTVSGGNESIHSQDDYATG